MNPKQRWLLKMFGPQSASEHDLAKCGTNNLIGESEKLFH